jgi:hypothetical protein
VQYDTSLAVVKFRIFFERTPGKSSAGAVAVTGMDARFKIEPWEPPRFSQHLRPWTVLRRSSMCRNIKTLFNFDPPVTPEEVRAASLQFVRKISGFAKPSKANESVFLAAVDEVAEVSARLLHSLETNAPPKNREEEAARAKARAAERFGA